MKKRLFDCDCWKDPWFRRLKPKYKLIWVYILTNCECWGEWKPDSELAEFCIGEEIDLDSALLEINKNGKIRVEILSNGNWFISGFNFFQYGELSEKCNAHKPVLENLKRLKKEGYLKGTYRDHNKNKDKDKDKEKEKEIISTKNESSQSLFLDQFSGMYEQVTGHSFKRDKKHYIMIADLIKKYTYEQIVEKTKILAIYCERAEVWFCKNGWSDFTPETLVTHWNRIVPILNESQKKQKQGIDSLIKAQEDRKKADELLKK